MVAVSGVAVLTLLGVAAVTPNDVRTPTLGHGPPRATAAVTSPGSMPPLPARPLRHAQPVTVSPGSTGGAAAPVPSAGATPGGQTPERPPPRTPEQSAPTPHQTTRVPLAIGSGLTATLYVGQLDQLLRRLDGTVTFNTSSSFRAERPRLCVMTVVIDGVSGNQAAVYARGLGSGWGGAEGVPDQRVAADDGTLHQQLVTPPPAAPAGQSWTGSAALHVDGELVAVSAAYRLILAAVDGPIRKLRVGNDGAPVECRVY